MDNIKIIKLIKMNTELIMDNSKLMKKYHTFNCECIVYIIIILVLITIFLMVLISL